MAKTKPVKPFTMVRRSIWGSARFAALPSDTDRYLYIYLLTCPHQTASGCFKLKEGYALDDLRMTGANWTADKYRAARSDLVDSGLICHDEHTGEILISRWWQDNPPDNEAWFVGARRQCEAIESPELQRAALAALEECYGVFLAGKELSPPAALRTGSGQHLIDALGRHRLNAV